MFLVRRAGWFPASNVWYIDGDLESGQVVPGMVAHSREHPSREVVIKSIALGYSAAEPKILSLAIHKPTFPIEELAGDRLIGAALPKP